MTSLPLGLLKDPGNELLLKRLNEMERYDFSEITRQCIEKLNWVEGHAHEIEFQTKQFLSLAFLDQDHYHIPEADIDEYWHRMILNTSWYETFCNIIFGAYYHHTPMKNTISMDIDVRVRSKGLASFWYGKTWNELVTTCTQCKGPKPVAKHIFEQLKPDQSRLPNIKEITKGIKP